MLDESALRFIGDQAIAATSNRVPDGIDAIALPQDHNLHNLEPYRALRSRFRGALATADLASFVDYVTKLGAGRGFINADAGKLSAKVFFNLGDASTPGHADWHATLSPKATAAYAALCAVNGKRHDQRELIEWIEDWAAAGGISAIAQDDDFASANYYGALSKAVSAIRQVTIKATNEQETTQGNFTASRSSLDSVEAKSRLDLPAGFRFSCVPFLGLPEREFLLRLSVLTSSKDPVLVLRVVQFEAQQEAIAQDFKEVLIREIGDAATLTIGTFTP